MEVPCCAGLPLIVKKAMEKLPEKISLWRKRDKHQGRADLGMISKALMIQFSPPKDKRGTGQATL